MTPAPIALFTYNRPEHTRQTVESLLANELAGESDLYIFSDAPKTPEAAENVKKVRAYLETVSGFRSVTLVKRETNLGLAANIVDGVGRLCRDYGRVIVLEDDLVMSPFFLRFMNDALELYQNEPGVMHVSGSTYPTRAIDAGSSYFLRVPLCWGWATWDRAWQHFSRDIVVMDKFSRKMIREFDFDGTYHYWRQLELNRSGKLNTWFVFWYATLFLNKGVALFPGASLVKNIGMDGTGVHCAADSSFDVEPSKCAIGISAIPVEESREAFERHKRYFRGTAVSLTTRVVRRLAAMVKGLST